MSRPLPARRFARGAAGPYPGPDPLTQVLDRVRLRCWMPSAHEMTAPWGMRFGWPSREEFEALGYSMARGEFQPMQGEIVGILDGTCRLDVPTRDVRLTLAAGDVALILGGDRFVLCDDWATPVRNISELVRAEDRRLQRGIRHGGGGALTRFLVGAFFLADTEEHPILAAMPPVIHVRADDPSAGAEVRQILGFMAAELAARPPGFGSTVNRLAGVLFVQAVRAFVTSRPAGASGDWFAAIFDADFAPVLGAMHARPAEPWTVATLADLAGMSRSTFSARFAELVGKPPLEYLTDCRMERAKTLLRDTRRGMKSIAGLVGYANAAAFCNAFRRRVGQSAGDYRKRHAAPGDAQAAD